MLRSLALQAQSGVSRPLLDAWQSEDVWLEEAVSRKPCMARVFAGCPPGVLLFTLHDKGPRVSCAVATLHGGGRLRLPGAGAGAGRPRRTGSPARLACCPASTTLMAACRHWTSLPRRRPLMWRGRLPRLQRPPQRRQRARRLLRLPAAGRRCCLPVPLIFLLDVLMSGHLCKVARPGVWLVLHGYACTNAGARVTA
jgi:hypothetical protein